MVASGVPACTYVPSSSLWMAQTSPFWTALSGFGLRSRVMVAMSVPGRSFHVPFGPMTLSPSLSEPKVTTPVCGATISCSSKGKP